MRRYFYLITDHPDDDMVGIVESTEKPKLTGAEKNNEGVCQKRDLETNETWQYHEVGLGYVDFDGEEDYEENCLEEIDRKLGEVDDEYLEKAGLDPEEVAA